MSILAEIVGHKRQEVAARKTATPRAALEARCATLPPPRDFERALAPAPGRARLVAEVKMALATGRRVLGINSRDLPTFETRLETTLALLPQIPPGPIVVSESGFFTGADVRRVIEAGAHAVLVGEGLVKAADVGAKTRELRPA